jgi:hypothetical protein
MLNKLFAALFCAALTVAPARAAGPITSAVNSPAQSLANLTARAVNLAALGDAATIAIPSYVTAYQVTKVLVTNCSATPILAQVGLFTGASGGGTTVAAAAVITGATSASVVLSQTVTSAARLTASNLFVNVAVANAAPLTCDLKVSIEDLS